MTAARRRASRAAALAQSPQRTREHADRVHGIAPPGRRASRRRSGAGSSCRRRRSACRAAPAHGRQQRQLGHPHRHVVVVGGVAECSRHAAAARFDRLDASPGIQRSTVTHGAGRVERLLVAMAVHERAALGQRVERQRRAVRPPASRTRNSSISSARSASRCAPHRRARVPGIRRAATAGTTARARRSPRRARTCGASASTIRAASRRASSTSPCARNVRPQHSGRDARSPPRGVATATR